VSIDQAQSRAQTIFEFAPRSSAARWIAEVSQELCSLEPNESGR
jgi:Flp pilus assembly CpaE family ATPase